MIGDVSAQYEIGRRVEICFIPHQFIPYIIYTLLLFTSVLIYPSEHAPWRPSDTLRANDQLTFLLFIKNGNGVGRLKARQFGFSPPWSWAGRILIQKKVSKAGCMSSSVESTQNGSLHILSALYLLSRRYLGRYLIAYPVRYEVQSNGNDGGIRPPSLTSCCDGCLSISSGMNHHLADYQVACQCQAKESKTLLV